MELGTGGVRKVGPAPGTRAFSNLCPTQSPSGGAIGYPGCRMPLAFDAPRRRPLPSTGACRAWRIDPPAVATPEGVITGYTDSSGEVDLDDGADGDTDIQAQQ